MPIVTGDHVTAGPHYYGQRESWTRVEPVRCRPCHTCIKVINRAVEIVGHFTATVRGSDAAKVVEHWQLQPKRMPTDGLEFVHRWF
jgi:hypothetical protein